MRHEKSSLRVLSLSYRKGIVISRDSRGVVSEFCMRHVRVEVSGYFYQSQGSRARYLTVIPVLITCTQRLHAVASLF